MNAFAFSCILVIVSNLSIAALVLWKSSDRKIGYKWAFLCLTVAIWGFGGYKFSTTTSKETAFFWWQIAHFGAVLTPVIYYHFVSEYLKKKKHLLLFLLYFLAAIFLFFNLFFKELFLGDLRVIFNQFYWHNWYKDKSLIYLFFYISFYWYLLAYAFLLLLKYYRHTSGIKRNQLKYFLLGSVFGWLGAHGNFPVCFGLDIYPYANFLIAIYSIMIGYAMVKHHLMDIDIVIKKGLVYSLLVAVITAGYLVFVMTIGRAFQGVVGYQPFIINLLAIFIIALLFNPLRDKIQHFLDKRFFKGTLESLSQEKERLQQELTRSERLKAVATFASGMAHEIKNPLTSIKTFTEYLPSRKNDSEFLNKFSKIVSGEVNRIDSLVHQLLNFAKPAPLNLKAVDIHKLLDDILSFLSNDFLKHKIKVIKEFNANIRESNDANSRESNANPREFIRGNACLIKADQNQIKQSFLNLFLNSIDAMPNGGTLVISTKLSSSDSRSVVICVKDTGGGISKEDRPHIFEPFYSKKEDSTGLGLSIVYNIVKEHSGNIDVKSEAGEGAEFIIELLAMV